MPRATTNKKPVEVSSVGNIADGNFRDLAALLLRLREQSTLKIVNNEQPSRPLPPVK